jgi:2,4-dienoyl-CoA reductase-like NADH-dependent reductase (Old Yellow Enzyme family)
VVAAQEKTKARLTIKVITVEGQFKNVLRPISIGRITIQNRIALSPINTSFGDTTGKVTERLLKFHTAISEGKVGLSIAGSTAISPEGKVNYLGLTLDSDKNLDGLRQLFQAIERAGSIPAIQLMHAGRQTFSYVTGRDVVAPSSLASPYFGATPRALETSEIENIVREFATAASRARKAGAKLIELHGAHGYLIGQFLSPLSNIRNDEYGGSLPNRARFFCEIVEEAKRELGMAFPVVCRMSVSEHLQGGITPKDTLEFAKLLVESGADCISVSTGIYGQKENIYPTRLYDRRIRFETSRKIKKTLSIPVICGGRISTLFEAEKMLCAGKADMISMGRALVADPHLITKSISGEIASIQQCKWCNKCTYDFQQFQSLSCAVNPSL